MLDWDLWEIVKDHHSVRARNRHLVMHKTIGPCGFVGIIENSTYHCMVCGKQMPKIYEDLALLAGTYFLPIDSKDLHWDKE